MNLEEIKQAFANTCNRTRINAHFFYFDAWVVTLADAVTLTVLVAAVVLPATLVLAVTSVLVAVVVVLAAPVVLVAAVAVGFDPVVTGLVARGATSLTSS